MRKHRAERIRPTNTIFRHDQIICWIPALSFFWPTLAARRLLHVRCFSMIFSLTLAVKDGAMVFLAVPSLLHRCVHLLVGHRRHGFFPCSRLPTPRSASAHTPSLGASSRLVGDPSAIRTRDLPLRRRLLCPAELWDPARCAVSSHRSFEAPEMRTMASAMARSDGGSLAPETEPCEATSVLWRLLVTTSRRWPANTEVAHRVVRAPRCPWSLGCGLVWAARLELATSGFQNQRATDCATPR